GVLELVPGQRGGVLGGDPAGHVGDHVARVQGEHHETGFETAVDALGGLDVVAVGAEAAVPSGLDETEDGIVHDRAGAAAQAVHLPDRLLGEDGHHGRGLGRERPCLAGSGQAGAVTGAHGRAMAADPLRPQARDRGLQCVRVRGGQRSGEHVAVTGGAGRGLEGRHGLGRRRILAQRTGGGVGVDARGDVVGAQGHQGSVPAGWGTPSAPTATQASWGPRSHISSHLERGFRRWCRPPRTLTLRYCAPGAPGSWSAPADGQGPRAFVERTTMRRSTSERPHSDRLPLRGRRSRAGAVILAVGALMVALYSVVFILLMAQEGAGHSWATAVYWTITTMSTLGYGDITFESDAGRLFSLWVLLSGVVYMLVLLPFFVIQYVVTPWLDRRRAARTPRKVPPPVHDRVQRVGSDAVTQHCAARAERSGVAAVVVPEDSARAAELHDQGRQVLA